MANPTPDPSIDELYEALSASGIRLDKVWSGVKEVIAAKLPGMISRYNIENNRGAGGIKKPVGYYTGGVNLNEKMVPSIVVGSESEFNPLGPSQHTTTNTTCVWVVTPAKTTQAIARDAAIMAHLVHGVLMGYQQGYQNAWGQRLWLGLSPGSVRAIAKSEQNLYGGFFITLDIVQGPSPTSTSLYKSGEDIDEPEPPGPGTSP